MSIIGDFKGIVAHIEQKTDEFKRDIEMQKFSNELKSQMEMKQSLQDKIEKIKKNKFFT